MVTNDTFSVCIRTNVDCIWVKYTGILAAIVTSILLTRAYYSENLTACYSKRENLPNQLHYRKAGSIRFEIRFQFFVS